MPQPWRAIIDWIVTIVGAIAIVFAIKSFVVNPYRIPSSSMEPTLHCAASGGSGCLAHFSDRVLANRFIYHLRDPRRGEIIVFNVPDIAEEKCGAGGVFVKRIIGLPGDVWQERQGFVYINGKKLNEPYIKKDRRDFESWPARKIPKDNYFMMGDNRQSSCDSRKWGTVPRNRIIGKVFAIYWPPQRIRHVADVSAFISAGSRGALRARVLGPLEGCASVRRAGGQAALPASRQSRAARLLPFAAGLGPFCMSKIIEELERAQLRDGIPQFKAGDTVRVHFQVIEGERRRLQVFEGVVIKRQGAGVRETFTVRKQSFGVGVERTFPVHSPKIEKIEVGAIGDVNRAKLYYLRGRVGKKARIREIRQDRTKAVAEPVAAEPEEPEEAEAVEPEEVDEPVAEAEELDEPTADAEDNGPAEVETPAEVGAEK